MSDTTSACLDMESESIKPDVRVAYTNGLVLGVDEFVQEQRYLLEKDYLHNRSLHGYGTVYGLAVNIAKSQNEADPNEKTPKQTKVIFGDKDTVWLKVGPGVGVDQRGRTFVIPETYCINFTDWWNELIHNTDKKQPELKQTKDGKQQASIYICARFDETCGDEVTIAGQACNNGSTSTANSRIYDSVYLEPSVEKPVMSTWSLAQRFAWLMGKIRKVPGIKLDTDVESALLNYLRFSLNKLDYRTQFDTVLAGLPNQPSPDYIQLPEGDPETSNIINNLTLAYITDVVPLGHFADAYQQPEKPFQNDILLAQIDLTGVVNDAKLSTIEMVSLVEDERPYLLGTQTFQELVNIGKRDKNRRHDFASLHVESSTSLFLWIYQPADKILKLPLQLGSNTIPPNPPGAKIGGVVLRSYGAEFAGKISKITDELYTIELDPDDNGISVGSPVELIFNLDHLTDKQDKALDTMLFNDFVGLNEDGNVITIHTFADNLAAIHSLATINARQDDTDGFVLDVGFDRDVSPLADVTPLWCQIFVDNSELTITNRHLDDDNPRLWHLFLPTPDKENNLLVLRFNTDAIKVGDKLLSQVIHDEQMNFVGYDGSKFIELTYIVPVLLTRSKIEAIVDGRVDSKISAAKDDLRQNDIEPLQILPFATITPIQDGENVKFEIWLHPTLISTNYGDAITIDSKNLQIKTESAGIVDKVDFQISTFDKAHPNPDPNIFTVTLIPSADKDLNIAYLRFIFLTDNILWGGASLKSFKKSHHIRFFGNYLSTDPKTGYDYIIIYVRNQIMPTLAKLPPPNNLKALAAAEPKVEEPAPTLKPRTRRVGGKT